MFEWNVLNFVLNVNCYIRYVYFFYNEENSICNNVFGIVYFLNNISRVVDFGNVDIS